jgi:hypothetical protein
MVVVEVSVGVDVLVKVDIEKVKEVAGEVVVSVMIHDVDVL